MYSIVSSLAFFDSFMRLEEIGILVKMLAKKYLYERTVKFTLSRKKNNAYTSLTKSVP